MLTVVTGWSPKGFEEYGRRFADTFAKYWPSEVELVVYGEKACYLPRGSFRLLSEIEGCQQFIDRHSLDRYANGRSPVSCWKPRERELGYSFRTDAVKFSRQGFIPHDAAEHCATRYMMWLDGDVVTHAGVDLDELLDAVAPRAGKAISYLGREPKWPDIAFQLYDLGPTYSRPRSFLRAFRDAYASDQVLTLPQTHSAYVWHHLAGEYRDILHNVTPAGAGHVWMQSPLAKWTDHLKGDRKKAGRSVERH